MRKRQSDSGPVLKDIAVAAGVSIMTASRALRGVEGVSEAKRHEILRIARRLKYTPNSSARSLVTMNSDLLGISVPNLFNDVFAEMLAGMRRTFDMAGFSSVVDTTEYSLEVELAWAERLLSWRPAGFILTGTKHHPKLSQTLRRSEIPTLQMWDVTEDPIDVCVGIDHVAAGRLVAERCIALGYRRPGFVGVSEGRDPRAEGRMAGFQAAFAEVSDAAPLCLTRSDDPNSFVAGRDGTAEMLACHQPDVLFYVTDHQAFGGLSACVAAGLSVPDDIGVIGFNALDLTTVLPTPLTTVRTPRKLIGTTGARHLLARINRIDVPRLVTLPVEFVPGATIRAQ
ncbi:LacI family DNA-binding transcriptional regulator [Tateyamaria sp.]|uniref:LacI family DNA-binding transcriptional regulator n=1 Tax=Tateyamaria sp. TaxID=1929288 RepID=UPI003B227224